MKREVVGGGGEGGGEEYRWLVLGSGELVGDEVVCGGSVERRADPGSVVRSFRSLDRK